MRCLNILQSLQMGIELVTRAVNCDKNKNFKEAYYLYCKSLQYFIPLITEEADASKRLALRNRTLSYLRRAEELKNDFEREYKPPSILRTQSDLTDLPTSSNATNEYIHPQIRFKHLCKIYNTIKFIKHILFLLICKYFYSCSKQFKPFTENCSRNWKTRRIILI